MKITQLQQQYIPITPKKSLKAPPAQGYEVKLKKSAQDLESLFLTFVLKAMEKTVPKEHEHSASLASMMFSNVMGKGMADQGGIGLAKFFFNAMKQNPQKNLEQLNEQIKEPTIYNIGAGRLKNE